MNHRPWTIRHGVPADANALAVLGERVFRQTFGDDPEHPAEDMDLFVGEFYAVPKVLSDLNDPEQAYFVAADAARELIGFVRLSADEEAVPDCVSGPRPIEIVQFYVDFAWHSRGVAASLMEAALSHARERRFATVWLGVWHRNLRAQKFYRKWGFERVGDHPFQFGRQAQTDEVFARPLI
jgi:ribosomal protein S18 acetylase RimI-like enzyme